MTNLSLDLYQIDCHAQEYMRKIGITYEHATPQSIADCWWFWNCTNVPETLPAALSALKITPSEAVGYGLSLADADRLERSTTKAMITNRSGSSVTIPTVDDVLSDTAIGNGYHDFAVVGGTIRLTESELRPALEAAYDPNMPDWPVLVEIEA